MQDDQAGGKPGTSDTVDVAVVEDVWGAALAELSKRRPVVHDSQAWSDREALYALAGRARALVVRNRAQVDRRLLESSPNLEVVGRAGVGLDNIDLVAADELGVVVVAATGANAASVAEHSLAMALALAKNLSVQDRRVRAGVWQRELGVELTGKCWGVIGLGATGQATAKLAAAIGMEVLGYDPFIPKEAPAGSDRSGSPSLSTLSTAKRVPDLDELLGRARVISVHLMLSDQTRGLVDADFIARMRNDAYLINVARGELVDEDALADGLQAGQIAGAALDVRNLEPPHHSRLDGLDNVVLSPHVAGLTVESQHRVVEMVVRDVDAVLSGGEASNAVGRHTGSTRA
ncbi:MAG: hydroxyacid dehydrogenase [Actinobacteria bacterium]|nr:hydroxyacid dehydrogenase [Actinomycetota bacterium]